MDLEDRLRNQLHGQSNNIHVEIASPATVAHRSAARTRRRLASVPVAALMLVGLVGGGIWMNQDQNDPGESVSLVGDDSSGDETSDGSVVDGDTPDLERLIAQGFSPGPELVLQDISSENSPGGWGALEVHDSGGVYYVLSTAPGPVDLVDYSFYRPDTLYAYDGGSWSTTGFGDRLVADFDVSADGVLYTVSTGTTNGDAEFALGRSTDGGQSWTWDPLPTEGYEPAELAPRFALKGDTPLIVSQLPPRQHFAAAAELARSAGLEVSDFDITQANLEGIGYLIHPVSDDPCVAAEDAFWQSEWSAIDAIPVPVGAAENPTAFDAEAAALNDLRNERLYAALREAGCGQEAECQQINANFYNDPANRFDMTPPGDPAVASEAFAEYDEAARAFYAERQVGLDQLLIDGGCGQEVVCRNLQNSFYEEELPRAPFEPPVSTFEGSVITDEEVQAMDEAWAEYYEQSQAWENENRELIDESYARHEANLVANGCASMFAPEAPEEKFVEWSSLGVAAPTDWFSSLVQVVGPDGVQMSTLPIDSYIQQVLVDGDEYVIAAIDSSTLAIEGPMRIVEWRSVDGSNWTMAEGEGLQPFDMAEVNGQRFRLTWREGQQGSVLERSVRGNPATQQIDIADLVPGLSADLTTIQVSGGPLGVLILAAEMSPVAPPKNFFALYSPDGIRWSAQPLASSAHAPSIGTDSVLLFGESVPNADEPSAVYLGRVGG